VSAAAAGYLETLDERRAFPETTGALTEAAFAGAAPRPRRALERDDPRLVRAARALRQPPHPEGDVRAILDEVLEVGRELF
jgi:hypothetical protein